MVGVKQSAKKRMKAVNERGALIGEDHPRAVLTDRDVELLLELRAEGWTLRRLAEKFEISFAHAGRVARGDQRGQVPHRWVRALDGRGRR